MLREVAHPDIGVVARTKSANDSLLRSMATPAQQMEDFVIRLERQVWTTWLPVIASAALALGFALGMWFGSTLKVASATPGAGALQQTLTEAPPQLHVTPQRREKHHRGVFTFKWTCRPRVVLTVAS